MKAGKMFLGGLAGLATGVLLGILFAPDKGSETRKQIMNKGEDYADALKEKFNDLVDAIASKFDDTRKEAEEYMAKGKKKYDELKNVVA